MATYPNIADNEMNYYQFKAKQIVQQERENGEWKDFFKQSASQCAACLAENESMKETKDIAIQAFPKRSVNKTEQMSLKPRHQNEQAEALNNIKTRLEKIDLALSNLVDVPQEIEKEKKPTIQEKSCGVYLPFICPDGGYRSYKEQRKHYIRNTLNGLHNIKTTTPRETAATRLKNPSFFLPHDLQVQRASSRRAYLASLQTKPKVSFQNEKQSSINNPQPVPNRKKIGLKVLKRKGVKKEVKAEAAADAKDENIEKILADLLDDLYKEVAIDLYYIIQRKRERYLYKPNQNVDLEKKNGSHIPLESLTSSLMQNMNSEITVKDASKGLASLKSFFLSSIATQQEKHDIRNEQLIDKSTSTHANDLEKTLPGIIQMKNELKTPKFVCDVSHIITVDPAEGEEISFNRDKYCKYLEKISRICKGNFNPFRLNNALAEDILDDCLYNIAEEISENFASDLYRQEFAEQVES